MCVCLLNIGAANTAGDREQNLVNKASLTVVWVYYRLIAYYGVRLQ